MRGEADQFARRSSVQRVVALERRGLNSRVPRQPRTIRLLLLPDELPSAATDQNHCDRGPGRLVPLRRFLYAGAANAGS